MTNKTDRIELALSALSALSATLAGCSFLGLIWILLLS
jgi:hypothetical protein